MKTLMGKCFIFLMILLGLFQAVRADVLFLDFNDSQREIDEITKYLRKQTSETKQQKLYVLPNYNNTEKLKFRDFLGKLDELNKGLQLEKSATRLQQLKSERQALVDSSKVILKRALTKKIIMDEIRNATILKKSFDTLVISGHNVPTELSGFNEEGAFFGRFTNGKVTLRDLKDIFSTNPSMRYSIKKIIILSCYGATLQMALKWKDAFPNLELAAGYSLGGPEGKSYLSSGFAIEFLKNESYLKTIVTASDAFKFLKKMQYSALGGALYLNGIYVNLQDQKLNLNNVEYIANDCQLGAETLLKRKSVYDQYYFSLKGLNNPPSDTVNSDLRRYYDILHRYSHCFKKEAPLFELKSKILEEIPHSSQVAALIHFKDVRISFSKALDASGVKDEIKSELKQLPKSYGLDYLDFGLPTADRKKIISFSKKLEKVVADRVLLPNSHLTRLLSLVNTHLIQLECIPVNWLTESKINVVFPVDCH